MLAVLRTLRTYRPTRLRVTVDGHARVMAAWLVAVANTRTYASGMMIAPDAAIDDGLLDVCVVGDVSRPEFLRTFPSVYRGGHVRNPQVTMRRGTQVHHRVGRSRGATRAVGERRAASGPLPADDHRGARRGPCRHVTSRDAYLTVIVPSMPCWRWFGMSQ